VLLPPLAHAVPQSTVGTRLRPWRSHAAQNSWLPGGATLRVARGRGGSAPSPVVKASGWAGARPLRNGGLAAPPLCGLHTPPHDSLTPRTRGAPETGPGPAGGENRPAPVCARRLSVPRTRPAGRPCAGRTGGSADRSESQRGPPQRMPNGDTCCRSWYSRPPCVCRCSGTGCSRTDNRKRTGRRWRSAGCRRSPAESSRRVWDQCRRVKPGR
jgi:hypothetical protein